MKGMKREEAANGCATWHSSLARGTCQKPEPLAETSDSGFKFLQNS